MRDLLPKIMKWVVSVFCLIFGTKMMNIFMNGENWGLMVAMLSFAVIYWQYNEKNVVPKEVLMISVFILAAAGEMANALSVFSFYPFNSGFFSAWMGWSLLVGIPVIGWTFKKFG